MLSQLFLFFYLQNSTIIALVNELYQKIRAVEKENSASASTTPISNQTILGKVDGLESKSLDHVDNLRSRFNDMKHVSNQSTVFFQNFLY